MKNDWPLINDYGWPKVIFTSLAKKPVFQPKYLGGSRVLLLQETEPYEAMQQAPPQVSQENVLRRGECINSIELLTAFVFVDMNLTG